MANAYGLSFSPQTIKDPREARATGEALGPAQRAIQTLSLSLPRVLGARSVSPRSLLEPQARPQGAGSPESAVLQTLLKTLMPGAAGMSAGGPAGPAPQPFTAPDFGQGGGNEVGLLLEELMRRMGSPAPTPNIKPIERPVETSFYSGRAKPIEGSAKMPVPPGAPPPTPPSGPPPQFPGKGPGNVFVPPPGPIRDPLPAEDNFGGLGLDDLRELFG